MVSFPVLERLDVSDYALFPGSEASGRNGLHVTFLDGLTLVLGTNGLGKTTLVTMMYRILSGPFEIPGLAARVELGSGRLTPTELSAPQKRLFAQRVTDGARDAQGTLTFRLADRSVTVRRRLTDLRLTSLSVGATERPATEDVYQQTILELSELGSFGDWILMLRHLTFYFEDRRALVWDPTAQRQVLRFLFLPSELAAQWSRDERAILELDSRIRNTNAALFGVQRSLADTEARTEHAADVFARLRNLEEEQSADTARRELLQGQRAELEASRQQARQRAVRARHEREAGYRQLERLRLLAITARYPSVTQTSRYILAQLIAEGQCQVCGRAAPDASREYGRRLDEFLCTVCGQPFAEDELADGTVAPGELLAAAAVFDDVDREQRAAELALEEAQAAYEAADSALAELERSIAERASQIQGLIARLPPDDAAVHEQRTQLSSLRARLDDMRAELAQRRDEFRDFIGRVNRDLVDYATQIREAFGTFSSGFLLEASELVWSPHASRVGETGELVEFPNFELDLTGADFPMPVRRTGPEQVSESQREFIDLSFRMALMTVAGHQSTGSLVIDAPESSLDAVFVSRAANVFQRFAEPRRGNRLVLMSNLLTGGLVEQLIGRLIARDERNRRVVDLFELAAPTAAVRQHREEYARIRDALLAQGRP